MLETTTARSTLFLLDIVLIFDRHTLCLGDGQRCLATCEGGSTYHVVDLVHANKTRRKLKHVVAQRDDNELSVLRALLDVARNDRHLCTLVPHSHGKSVRINLHS